jgi:endonuclease/exonuclease/phosphatase family metal-dependent hydrolase
MKYIETSVSRVSARFKSVSRQWVARSVLLSLLGWLVGPTPAAAQSPWKDRDRRDLRVMTYNVNEGTDFLQIQAATDLNSFLVAVGQTITQVRGTDPPARMRAVAKQIIDADPTLVSLEEADEWYTSSFNPATGACGTPTLEFAMLQELQDALAAQGAHYTVAEEAQQYAFPLIPGFIPPSTYLCVSLVNHVAILARTDLDPERFQWSNPQSAQYATMLQFPSPIGLLPLPRAWVSVDATFDHKTFRYIGTHLESVVPAIREAQGAELRAGPANTSLPVILAMDSNAPAAPLPQDPTYMDFIAAGYDDGWTENFPLVPGFTCCQDEADNNPESQLYQRIDLILTLGHVKVRNIALFGADPQDRIIGGLWPSDHAGVAAHVAIERE